MYFSNQFRQIDDTIYTMIKRAVKLLPNKLHTLCNLYCNRYIVSSYLVFACILFVFTTTHSLAIGKSTYQQNTTKTDSTTKRSFKVGVSYLNQYPVYSAANNGEKGIGWAILKAFGDKNDIEFEFVSMPMTKLQPAMDDGAIDFIFPDNPKWSGFRSKRFPNIYSATILEATSATFVTVENKNLEISEIRKVAVPFGYTSLTWVDPIKSFDIKSIPVRDLNSGLNILRTGSVDAADIEYNTAMHLIKNNDLFRHRLTISKKLPHSVVHYKLSSIKHIMVLEKLSLFMQQEQALIQKLKAQYKIKEFSSIFPNVSKIEQVPHP